MISKMKREERKEHAQLMLSIMEDKKYTVNGETIHIPPMSDAVYFRYSKLKDLCAIEKKAMPISKVNIEVINMNTVDAVLKFGYGKSNVGVLNFASALHPGGGFITGAMAQEEALCHASTLYNQLKNNKMYKDNKRECTDGLYNHSMCVCDSVFFKNGEGELQNKQTIVTVVTSAAVNRNRVSDKNPELIGLVNKTMEERIEEIVKMFIRCGNRTIIVGAFGCGVFGNEPDFVAKTWKKVIEQYGGHFDTVIFAIMDKKGTGNYKVFKDILCK